MFEWSNVHIYQLLLVVVNYGRIWERGNFANLNFHFYTSYMAFKFAVHILPLFSYIHSLPPPPLPPPPTMYVGGATTDGNHV